MSFHLSDDIEYIHVQVYKILAFEVSLFLICCYFCASEFLCKRSMKYTGYTISMFNSQSC